MLKNKSGDLLGVFHRDDVGDIDLVWGDRNKNSGLDHIIEKHIERLKDFSSAEEAIQVIEYVINNGKIDEKKSKWDKITIKYGDFTVVLRKNVRDENGNIIDSNKNWVVTAFDYSKSEKTKEKEVSSDATLATPNTNQGSRAVTSDETSDSKDSELSQKSKEDAEENKKPRLEKADSKTTEVSSTDALLRDALADVMRESGIEVITDNKEAQRVLEEENGRVRMQAKLDSLVKAVRTIHGWLSNNKRDKVFTIELPKATQEMIHKVMGRDFNSHNITANGIAHGLKNHGVNGLKLNKQSIPIRKEDAELIPYIMTAPDYVKKGSTDISGRESIRFYKELSNGYVVVVEKEYKNSLNDMETINIWAEMSSEATNALHKAVPDIHVQNAILSTDVAKIRKDAEDAIRRDNKLREQRVWHDSDKVRFFRTANGEAYGFTVDGKIYLDPTIAGAETAIHEYTHLWATALKSANPKEWSNIVSLLKGTPLWDKVASEYPELTTDDELADEVLAHYSGKRGAERLRKEAESIANGKGSLLDKAGAISALERVKEALTRFWKATADLLHIHFTTAEEVADKVLADLLNGVNPNAMQDRKELIAVHNITEDKLKKALSLGGFPMPSIAITKAEIGHETFGDISLIFDKESIDPTDKRNKVYGEDAWTPVFPNVGYKLNNDKTSTIYSKANKAGHLPMFNPVDFHQSNYENKIDERGDESLVERFKEDYGAKQLYLSETGNAVKEFLQHEVEKYRPESVALYEKLLKDIGIERLKNENYESLKDEIKQLINQHYGIDIDSKKPFLVKVRIQNTIHHAIDYAENGNLKTESDIDATKAKIDGRIDDEKFVKWLEKLFAGVVEKKGIRNDRDWFTSSGNRRKWEQLYDEITLDNVVDAMQKQASKGGEGLFGGSIFGSAQKEYSSIDEIRNSAKERIQAINEDDYQAQRDAITNRLSSIEIPGAGRGFSDTMDMTQNIQDAVTKSHTAKGIHKYLKRFYPKVTLEIAKEIEGIVKDIQRMSARYFEAKPYRAVGFEEVRLAIVPSDTDASLVEQLKQKGIEIRTYERGNQKQRKQIADEATRELNLRFQLIGEQGAEESTSGEDLEEVNARFNEELQQQIDGTLPQGHIYQLGMASAVLQSAGLPNLPIELSASRLKDKSKQEEHPFELSEMRGLVDSVQNPLAVFRSATHIGSFVVLTEIEHQGKNFVVAIQANRRQGRIEINSIRSVHYRNKNTHIANWITEGLLEYADKKRMAEWLSKQRYNSADVRKLFNHATKIVNEFDNPIINEENLYRKPVGGNSGYVGYSMSKRAEQAREDGRFPKTDFKREYKVSESSLQALSRIGIISDNEWHHTSSYGNKTTFYGWADEAFAEYYLEHKKEIDKATDDLLRLKEEDIDKYFSALDDFRKEMRKSFDVGTSGLSKSKYDFEQELRSRTSDEVVAEYQRQKSEYTSTESNPKPFPSILKWQSQNKDLVKEIENKVRQEMDQSSAIVDSVMSLAEKLHLDNVEIVTDASVLSGKEAKAKGFYSKSTGKITIVVPNNTSAEDAVQTLLHEAVAHYGLRQLFGGEFDNFLDAVLENADKEVLERIYDLAQANGWDYRKATEEYLATLAETTDFENTDKGWWNKVKKLFVEMLRKLGIKALDGTTLTDNELRYILWASYQNLKGNNETLIGIANDIVKREELGIEETEDDKLFRTEAEQPISYEQAMVRDLYDQRMASGVYQSIEALQDSMRSVKEFMGMVDKAENGKARYIEDVDDFENAYLGENRLSSQNKAETDLSANLLLKPLLKAMAIWIFYNFNCHKIHSEYIKGQ